MQVDRELPTCGGKLRTSAKSSTCSECNSNKCAPHGRPGKLTVMATRASARCRGPERVPVVACPDIAHIWLSEGRARAHAHHPFRSPAPIHQPGPTTKWSSPRHSGPRGARKTYLSSDSGVGAGRASIWAWRLPRSTRCGRAGGSNTGRCAVERRRSPWPDARPVRRPVVAAL